MSAWQKQNSVCFDRATFKSFLNIHYWIKYKYYRVHFTLVRNLKYLCCFYPECFVWVCTKSHIRQVL